ncbi:MAG: hypothetical protein ACLP9L_11630 [Thermoguttaceae bacterium]
MQRFTDREYPYQIEPAIPMLWGMACALGAIAFLISAMTSRRGLILSGAFIPQSAATIFYWVMCVVSTGVFVMSVYFAICGRLHPRRISLSEHSVSVPKARWSTRVTSIPYATISDFAEIKVRGEPFLQIRHAGRRTIVRSALFASEADYGPFCQSLMERVNASRNIM